MKTKLFSAFFLFFIVDYAIAQTTFSADVSAGCKPLTVHFTSTSPGTLFFWDFKDGGATSFDTAATHTFTTANTYNVEVKTSAGGALLATIPIHVYNKPSVLLTPNPNKGCTPLPVNFTASPQNLPAGIVINNYSWDYGDNSSIFSSPLATSSHTYLSLGGNMTVSVKIETNMPTCDTTTIFPNILTSSDNPTANFLPNPSSACDTPLTVNFINFSSSPSAVPLTSSWTLSDGTIVTGSASGFVPPPQTYTANGSYTTTLTVTDTNGCSGSTVRTVSIGKPVSSFTIPDTVCINAFTALTNTSSAGSAQWTFDGAATLAPAQTVNTFNPSVAYSTSGNHTITLVTTAGGCSSVPVSKTIYVQDPIASFTTTPTYSCISPSTFLFKGSSPFGIAAWNWILGDGTIKHGPSFSHNYYIRQPHDSTYFEKGLLTAFTTTLTIVTQAGCVSPQVTFTDTLDLPWARFMPDTAQGCAPLTVTFRDLSRSFDQINKWEWDYGDGTPPTTYLNSLPLPLQHTFNTPGTYSVSLIITNVRGCFDTSYFEVIYVGTHKTFNFTANPTSVCPGQAVTFSVSPTDTSGVTAWHYSSNYGETLNGQSLSQCFQNPNPTVVFDDSVGLQTITLTAEQNGCQTSVTHANMIMVNGPIAHFDYLTNCLTPFAVQFTDKSGGATGLSWDFGDGGSSAATGTFTHTYTTTGDYEVILTASGVCPVSKDTATVYVKKIKAGFTTTNFSDSLLCKGVNYTFDASDSSTDVFANCYKGYSWIFSDPAKRPITISSPVTDTINFDKLGYQTISLVVQDINGCTDTVIDTVKVFGITPKYVITDSTICFPDSVKFTDQSQPVSDTTIVRWVWNFGDGTDFTGPIPPLHSYPKQAYTIFLPPPAPPKLHDTIYSTLIVIDTLGCTDTVGHMLITYTPTSVISSPTTTNTCSTNTLTFTATDYTLQGSHLSYNWNFGDSIDTVGNAMPHAFASAGTYTVQLKYTEQSSGCNDSIIQIINVQDYPTAGFQSDAGVIMCIPKQVVFTDTSKIGNVSALPFTTTQWDYGTGTFSTGDSKTPVKTFPTRGFYMVRMKTFTTYGCADTASKQYQGVKPDGTYAISASNICKGDNITFTASGLNADVKHYLWDFGDGKDTTDVSPVVHTYNYLPPSGSTTAKFIMYSDSNRCNSPKDIPINIYYVKADFSVNGDLDSTVCLGQADTLTNLSSAFANRFLWEFNDGTPNVNMPTKATIYHTYADSGTYNIKLTASHSIYGCPDDTTQTVSVHALPVVTATGDTICKTHTVSLYATNNPFYTYAWTPKGELHNATAYNPYLTGSESETFTVTVTDMNKCVNSATAFLYVIQPLDSIHFDTTIVIGDTIKLPFTKQNDMVEFAWTPETGLSCTDCPYPKVHPLDDITYTVFMKDSCTHATSTFVVHVRPEMFLQLPTTFTPNGDGTNDIIYVKGWGIKDLLSFEIYNRWGELVFTTSELSEGWNGYYKGMLQNNDTYVWKVKAVTWRNTTLAKEGHFNLMR